MFEAKISYPMCDITEHAAHVYPAGEPYAADPSGPLAECPLCSNSIADLAGAPLDTTRRGLAAGAHLGLVTDDDGEVMHMRCVLEAATAGAIVLKIG